MPMDVGTFGIVVVGERGGSFMTQKRAILACFVGCSLRESFMGFFINLLPTSVCVVPADTLPYVRDLVFLFVYELLQFNMQSNSSREDIVDDDEWNVATKRIIEQFPGGAISIILHQNQYILSKYIFMKHLQWVSYWHAELGFQLVFN